MEGDFDKKFDGLIADKKACEIDSDGQGDWGPLENDTPVGLKNLSKAVDDLEADITNENGEGYQDLIDALVKPAEGEGEDAVAGGAWWVANEARQQAVQAANDVENSDDYVAALDAIDTAAND